MYAPPWKHSFSAPDEHPACLFCGNTEGTTLLGVGRRDVGVCEGCAAHAHWLWRLLPGDAPPRAEGSARVVPTRVKVLVTRLVTLSDGKVASPAAVDSYEFGLVKQPDGTIDLPTADLVGSESEEDAVLRTCAGLLVSTWSSHVEPLYVAYTPRGRLVRIYLVTAYADASSTESPRLMWRPWPLDQQVSDNLREFYCGFRDVWGLRVWKHLGQDARTSAITTAVREGAARYIRMQQQKRSGEKGRPVDTSMAEYWRSSMSDDERLVDKQLREHEEQIVAAAAAKKPKSKEQPRTEAEEPPTGGVPAEIAAGPPPADEDAPADGAEQPDEGGEDDVDFT